MLDLRPSQWADALLDGARANGGATVACGPYSVPTSGYVVGDPAYGESWPGIPTRAEVLRWTLARADVVSGRYVGSWVDADTGRTYLDVADIVADRADALALAVQRGELAIWDLQHACEIRVTYGRPDVA